MQIKTSPRIKLAIFVGATLLWVCCIVSVAVVASLANSTGTSIEVKRTGELSATINAVEFNHAGKLTIKLGKANRYTINGSDANLLQDVEMFTRGSTLVIKPSRWLSAGDSNLDMELELQELYGLEVNGSGQGHISDFRPRILNLAINGSGSITGSVIPVATRADINGSGIIKLQGGTRDAELNINGSGSMDLREFVSEEANVNIIGSGNIDLIVKASLEVDMVGGGEVRYAGNPIKVDTNDAIGGGKVEPVTKF